MTDAAILAVDVGTGSLKAMLVDERGTILGRAVTAYPTSSRYPGWAEQDPETWWDAFVGAVGRLRDLPGWKGLAAVGFTGQSPGVVLVDEAGRPIRPAIIWSDRRATSQSAALRPLGSEQQWRAWTGFASGWDAHLRPAKVRWLLENEPSSVRKARWILQPKDFLILRLTNRAVIDRMAMRGSGLKHDDPELWDLIGLPVRLLPEPVDPWTGLPSVEDSLLEGVHVFPGTYDGFSGLVGSGPRAAGEAVNVCGTSQVAGLVVAAPAPEAEGLSSTPLGGGLHSVGGPSRTGGETIEWAMTAFGFDSFEELEALALEAPPGSGGVVVLPYLAGERAPIWDEAMRGGLFGLGEGHGRAHVARALIEGHALVVADIVDRAERLTGARAGLLRCSGGASVSLAWLEARAFLLGIPVVRPEAIDASCMGAALFASLGLGWFSSLPEAGAALVRTDITVDPPALGPRSSEHLRAFRAAIEAARGWQPPRWEELGHRGTASR